MRFLLVFLPLAFLAVAADAAPPDARARAALALAVATTESDPFASRHRHLATHGIPEGAVDIGDGLHQLGGPGGCIWGPYKAAYRAALARGKPLIVHVGRRLDGMCHAARAEGWVHCLVEEWEGWRGPGVIVTRPHGNDLWKVAEFSGPVDVRAVLAEGRAPFTPPDEVPMTFFSPATFAPSYFAPPMTYSRPMMRGGRSRGGSC